MIHSPRDENILLLSDSYKATHWKQLPPRTTKVYSFFESRGGKWPATTFFGLQYLLTRYLEGVVVTREKIAEARTFFAMHFGDATLFNEAGWQHIMDAHGGRLPVRIRAVPEGTTVPNHNVLMTIENTDPAVPWLTNYLETLLVQVWYPSTVATQSREMKRRLIDALARSGDPELVDFKLHDFGFRGSTSVESAGIGGMAHLLNFKGTDTIPGCTFARDYYGEPMAAFSIPASEHATITAWGRDRESDAYQNMLAQFPGMVAVVSDSYDIFNACANIWGGELRTAVMGHKGTVVIRPDSGDPAQVVTRVLRILADKFGAERNAKGYHVLHPCVRVIQGDGIDILTLDEVLNAVMAAGFSADNLAFGSGGGLLQKVNRDTLKFAFKCSAVEVGGICRDVMKDPVTDPGKRSKAGRFALTRTDDGAFQTVPEHTVTPDADLLRTVFHNGDLAPMLTFAEVRANAALSVVDTDYVGV